eukprot:388055-Pyramimonas_sp.AAC.1
MGAERCCCCNGSTIVLLFVVAGLTRGAAETVMKGLSAIPEKELDRPTICFDGDGFYTINAVERYRA